MTDAPRKIMLADLVTAGACESQRDQFRETFGMAVEVTEANINHHGRHFDLGWAHEYLLTDEQQQAYREAVRAHKNYAEAFVLAWHTGPERVRAGIVELIRMRKWWELSRLAPGYEPDDGTSPGAEFLIDVADDVAVLFEDEDFIVDDANDIAFEVADGLVDRLDSNGMWHVFRDLGGWTLDPVDITGDVVTLSNTSDIDDYARNVLRHIAESVAVGLLEEFGEMRDQMILDATCDKHGAYQCGTCS